MPTYEVKAPDGQTYSVNAPDGASENDAIAYVQKNFYAPKSDVVGSNSNASTLQNADLGIIKGASNIGATLLSPFDALARLANGGKPISVGGYDILGQDRRGTIDQVMSDVGDPNSLPYKAGKIGAEVAGTAGAGGVLAKGASMIPALAKFAPALASGGFSLGNSATGSVMANAALRAIAGAANGAAQSGLVNPADMGAGAVVGGVMPGAVATAGKVASALAKAPGLMASNTIGSTTGAGSEAISQAFQAGKNADQNFLNNLRGNVPLTDVLDQVKDGLAQMRLARSNAYKSGMIDIKNDKSILDFAPIQKAVDDVSNMGVFNGKAINPKSADTVSELKAAIDDWGAGEPSVFHTPEGLDALKQKIGNIRDSLQFGSPARKAADTVYNAVRTQITDQAPTYASVMKDYSAASDTLNEVQRALGKGEKQTADSAMRRLQSLMRNNAQTNYGNRLNLAQTLADQGGQNILPSIAGQSLNSWTPRGMVGAVEKGGGLIALALNPALAAKALAVAPLTSPRLMGEAAYGLGRASQIPANVGGLLSATPPVILGRQALGGLLNNPDTASLMRSVPQLYLSTE